MPSATIRAAPVSSWREIDLGFRGCFEGIKIFIDFSPERFLGPGCESKWGTLRASRGKPYVITHRGNRVHSSEEMLQSSFCNGPKGQRGLYTAQIYVVRLMVSRCWMLNASVRLAHGRSIHWRILRLPWGGGRQMGKEVGEDKRRGQTENHEA